MAKIWQKLTFAKWPLEALKVPKIDKLTPICNREIQLDQGRKAIYRPILANIYLVILPIKWPNFFGLEFFTHNFSKLLKMLNYTISTPVLHQKVGQISD